MSGEHTRALSQRVSFSFLARIDRLKHSSATKKPTYYMWAFSTRYGIPDADRTDRGRKNPHERQTPGGDGGIRTLDTGLSPYASLAGKCLRPLGHVSTLERCRFIQRDKVSDNSCLRELGQSKLGECLRKSGFFQSESLVQGAHGQFHVFLVDQHRNLDLRCGNHQDVDALFRQSAELLRGDADMAAHSHTDDRHFRHFGIANNIA